MGTNGTSSRPIETTSGADIWRDTIIHSLSIMKDKSNVLHEFIMIHSGHGGAFSWNEDGREGRGAWSAARGCNPQDRIIPFLDSPPHHFARPKVAVKCHSHPKPGIRTILSICNIIRNDPESRTYSVTSVGEQLQKSSSAIITRIPLKLEKDDEVSYR